MTVLGVENTIDSIARLGYYGGEQMNWDRREFLQGLSATGGAGLLNLYSAPVAAEPPPETTTLTMSRDSEIVAPCYAPVYIAEEFLRLEGFTNFKYVSPLTENGYSDALKISSGQADITPAWAGDLVIEADKSDKVVALSGLHVGCAELFAGERVNTLQDLKGKKVAVTHDSSWAGHWFRAIVTYVGLDPNKDLEWVILPYNDWSASLENGDVDAALLWAPDAVALRNKGIAKVLMNTTTDKPWRDYFCCMVISNREFVRRNPMATKRALRAFLKAAELCSVDPEGTATWFVKQGYTPEEFYEPTLQMLREIPYGSWRKYDAEDTVRFYALRWHQLELIKTSPEVILRNNVDLRFLNELKRELKA